MSNYVSVTGGGYDFYECTSAMQKCIRRGLEEQAMFWAIELETRFHDYLWKRLQIISIEDIGIGDPQVVLYVAEMRKLYQELRKDFEKRGARSLRMALSNAILAMCRATKSRIGDEFGIVMYGRHEDGLHPEIPDFALDQHTKRGKEMGRGPEHFFSEGIKLKYASSIEDPYFNESVEIIMARKKKKPRQESLLEDS
jgi:replication-associated recombination protein RarA